MKQIQFRRNADDAVSPVVGVMLMLVVTIIIAAVVSAFAGGLASEQKKAPTAAMEMRIVNTGSAGTSHIFWKVLSVSESISTKDVKITTSWKAKDGTSGGATVLPWTPTTPNVHVRSSTGTISTYFAPVGKGPGINWTWMKNTYPEMQYGNYTLIPGVVFEAWPTYGSLCGYGAYGGGDLTYVYTDGACYVDAEDTDQVQAVLGKGWEHLRVGDIAKIKFIHIPSGKTIVEKDVTVSSAGD
jgi:FlaG/FlaF family flagellin (archaellin)